MARRFNGTSDFCATTGSPTALNLSGTPVSMCCWINFSSLAAANQNLLGKGYDGSNTAYYIGISPTQLSVGVFNGAFVGVLWSGYTFGTSTWVHIYGEWDGTSWRLYSSGVSVAGPTAGVGPISTTARFVVGAIDVNGAIAQFVSADICDAAVFNGSLTGPEIASLASGGLRPNTGMSKTLLGYWKMDASNPAADLSGNGNNLNITGTTVVADPPFTTAGPPPGSRNTLGAGIRARMIERAIPSDLIKIRARIKP